MKTNPLNLFGVAKMATSQDVVYIPQEGSTGYEDMFTFSIAPEQLKATPSNWVLSNVSDQTEDAIRELSSNISGLRQDIRELSKTIKDALPVRDDILIYRDISKDKAREEISAFLETAGVEMYPSDISEKLKIDYDLVTEILDDLRAQGKVEFP